MSAQPGFVAVPTIADAKEIFARLFVPVDFTTSSRHALGVAIELKRSFDSSLCLFHLGEDRGTDELLVGAGEPAAPSDPVKGAEQRLRRLVKDTAPDLADAVEVRACEGARPIEDLRREAFRWRATIVVAAAELRGGFFRSPAERLVHDFFVPVLLLPPVTRKIPIGLADRE